MQTKRSNWITAGVLLLATALAGAMARGTATSGSGGAVTITGAKAGAVSVRGTLDRTAVLRGQDGTARMELVIAAESSSLTASLRRPTDLVIILDRSGSMEGEKIEHARASIRELIAQLRPEDRFSLVSYASDSRVDVPLTHFDATSRDAIVRTVAGVATEGGTNMSGGLDLAFGLIDGGRMPDRVPHVILISDGLANEGDPTPQGLTDRARRAARGEFMLSTVGVGMDFNEQLMTAMADVGTGNYYFVQHSEDLGAVFAREFDAARSTVATGLALRIEPAAGVQVIDAAGYPLEHDGDSVVIRPGSLFAGQERRVWLTLQMPNHTVGEYEVGRLALSYADDGGQHTVRVDDVPKVACVAAEEEFYSRLDVDAWTRSVIVDQYNAMQVDVAREVKDGKRDQAMGRLRKFRAEVAAKNSHLESAPVDDKLADVDKLEEEVRSAFEGDEQVQAQRQNILSKEKGAAGLDGRRVGAKKETK